MEQILFLYNNRLLNKLCCDSFRENKIINISLSLYTLSYIWICAFGYLRELVTCYFFPEGVDTSGEHWMSGFWCGGAVGGNFWQGIKSVQLRRIISSSAGWQKTPCRGVPKCVKNGQNIVAGPPPPGEFSATEASCGKTPGLDQHWAPGEWQTSYTNY